MTGMRRRPHGGSGPVSVNRAAIGPRLDRSVRGSGARFRAAGGLLAVALAAGDEHSAPVTQWGLRLLLTAAVVAMIALGVWGMRRGWQRRAARQSDVPPPPATPAGLPPADSVPGLYVATTTAGDLLDRIVVHGLGNRGRADLYVRTEGVLIDRVGEPSVWIPRESMRDVRLGSGQAQKAFEAGGLILVRWALGPREVETGFRADDPDAHVATAEALYALFTSPGGTR